MNPGRSSSANCKLLQHKNPECRSFHKELFGAGENHNEKASRYIAIQKNNIDFRDSFHGILPWLYLPAVQTGSNFLRLLTAECKKILIFSYWKIVG